MRADTSGAITRDVPMHCAMTRAAREGLAALQLLLAGGRRVLRDRPMVKTAIFHVGAA